MTGASRTLSAALLACALASPAVACSPTTFCETENGAYLVRPAKGTGPAPLLMFLHGFGSSPQEVMADTALTDVADRLGAVLVAPRGQEVRPDRLGWAFPGTGRTGRDDVPFLDAVIDDVQKHHAIDRNAMVASGFSVGGSMIWYLACFGKTAFAAYVPVAGAFWEPQPAACPQGPRNIVHIHGLSDATVPMIGREVGPAEARRRQGVVMSGMALWQVQNGCKTPVVSEKPLPAMLCRTWQANQCTSGHSLGICLHDGDHIFRAEWLLPVLQWMKP